MSSQDPNLSPVSAEQQSDARPGYSRANSSSRISKASKESLVSGRLGANPSLRKQNTLYLQSPPGPPPTSSLPSPPINAQTPTAPPRRELIRTPSTTPLNGGDSPATSPTTERPTLKTKTSSIKSQPTSGQQSSLRSRSSSTATGLLEDVTPWELYPPIPENSTKYHIPTEKIVMATSNATTATGSVEDVTPWELVPHPAPSEQKSSLSLRSPSHLSPLNESPRAQSSTSLVQSVGSEAQSQDSQSRALKTGPMEDVTPWELEPGPVPAAIYSGSVRVRASMTAAAAEEVVPWDLHPVPEPELVPVPDATSVAGSTGKPKKKKSSRLGQLSSISGANKSLSDLGFIRRRRSTGNKSAKSRQAINSYTNAPPTVNNPVNDYYDDADDEMPRDFERPKMSPTSARFTSKGGFPSSQSTYFLTQPSQSPVIAPSSTASFFRDQNNNGGEQSPKFSTADRKILQQLKIDQDIRDAAYVVKGKGYPQQGGGVTPGKKHHAYSPEQVPYPRCYDRKIEDLDIWETYFLNEICESPTWHVFETPPTKVLDIGCGTGTWIAKCAKTWPQCHFVGLDVVPLQPDFGRLGERDLASRITWVHTNFLEGLPFPNEEFDFVHIKRIALGVPENKWDFFFDECARVLKNGGAIEYIEEDLFFPGKPFNNEPGKSDGSEQTVLDLSKVDSMISNPAVSAKSPDEGLLNANGSNLSSPKTNSAVDVSTSTTSSTMGPQTPSRPASPVTISTSAKHITSIQEEVVPGRSAQTLPSSSTFDPIPSSPEITGVANLAPPPPLPSGRPVLAIKTANKGSSGQLKSATSISPLQYLKSHATSPTSNKRQSRDFNAGPSPRNARPRRDSSPGDGSGDETRPQIQSRNRSHISSEGVFAATKKRTPKSEEPYLLRKYKAPRNPRDHSILEAIYMEMLASRFVNTSPLSLLVNYMEYHFKDVRTHPPVLLTFPPTALLHSEARYVTSSESSSESSPECSTEDEKTRDATRSKRKKHSEQFPTSTDPERSRRRCMLGGRNGDVLEELLSLSDLIRRKSPYIGLDQSRGYAFSPSLLSMNAPMQVADGKVNGRRKSRLPNTKLNISMQTLNMHLRLRASEILGCSEPMWEWVLQYQDEVSRGMRRGIKHKKSQVSLASADSDASEPDSVLDGIAEMTRDDFEMLLTNFEMDLFDQASVDYAMQERMQWYVFPSRRDHRRKAFDDACKKWDNWVRKQEKTARVWEHYQYHHRRRRSRAPGEESEHLGVQNDRYKANGNNHDIPTSSRVCESHEEGLLPAANTESKRQSRRNLVPPTPIPFSPSSLPPEKRLSRAFRVFVAWKGSEL